jgi:serine/threonine protein kinase
MLGRPNEAPPPPQPRKKAEKGVEIVHDFALIEYFERSDFYPSSNGEGREIRICWTGTIVKELEKAGPRDKGCIDFIERPLVVNPEQRPSAWETLLH